MSEEVICAFLRDFREHGQRAIAKVRETQPAAYLKLAVLLVPREHKVEHSTVISGMSDEQLEVAIAALQDKIDRANGKLIDAKPVKLEIPDPGDPGYHSGIYHHAATAIGPRKPRRKAPD